MNYVYEHDYAVLVRLKVPADARGTIPIRADARWLACTDKICVPEKGELSLDLPVGNGTPNRAQFDAWRQALPQPLANPAHFEVAEDKLRVAIPLPASVDVAKPYLFPMIDGPVDYEAKQDFSRSGDTLIAELQRKGAPRRRELPGVIALGNGRGLEFKAVPGAVSAGRTDRRLGWSAVLWAVLGAIAGGSSAQPDALRLPDPRAEGASSFTRWRRSARSPDAMRSLMPPAQSSGLARSAQFCSRSGLRARRRAGRSSCRTRAPSCFCCCSPSRSPRTCLACSNLPLLGGAAQPAGSFGTGALAAFVATPCAGPFLGAALGTALLLPLAGSVLVFAALGFGLALPFVAVAFMPALRARLAEAGPVDAPPSALPRNSDGRNRDRCIVAALSARRDRRPNRSRSLVRAAAGNARRLLAWRNAGDEASASPTCCVCRDVRDSGNCNGPADRIPQARRFALGRGSVERSAGRRLCSPGQAGLRLFHRGLVPQLQGQRGDLDRPRRGPRRLSERPA